MRRERVFRDHSKLLETYNREGFVSCFHRLGNLPEPVFDDVYCGIKTVFLLNSSNKMSVIADIFQRANIFSAGGIAQSTMFFLIYPLSTHCKLVLFKIVKK